MLDGLYLHSHAKQTASMLINGDAELGSVQQVLKFLAGYW